jgi:steroid delta-isomerase-like uncharacterized protein
MSSEANKAAINRLVDGFWNGGNAEVMNELFAPNFVNHSPALGSTPDKAGTTQANIMVRSAFSDSELKVEEMIADGDKIAWRWSFRGTNTGSLAGIPATGREVEFTGMSIDRFADGQIVERWAEIDFLGMLQQLGVVPTPEQNNA